jgi:hypothetical protein
MRIRHLAWSALFACTWLTVAAGNEPAIDLRLGGVGGVYLLAEPGELIIDVEKRDRNRRAGRTELRAVLAGPDRKVLQEATIPDDNEQARGRLGPAQRVRLSTHVPRKGVYALCITVSGDRYGEHMLWGFRTNCPHYLIETSRGHRDARHEEPIVMDNPDQPGDICFLPRPGAFAVELSGLPKGAAAAEVYDEHGVLQATLAVDAAGHATHEFAAQADRGDTPWRLHLPVARATVQIDGLTRWDKQDRYESLSLWTPDARSFFPFHPYRWLLTPYSRTLYGRPGAAGQAVFSVHNNASQARRVRLSVEFPGAAWPVRLSAEQVTLKAHWPAPQNLIHVL